MSSKLSDVLKVDDDTVAPRTEAPPATEPWRNYLLYVEDAKNRREIVMNFEEWQQAKKEEADANRVGAPGNEPSMG